MSRHPEVVLLSALLGACAAAPIRGPVPPPLAPKALAAALRARAATLRTASANLTLRTEGFSRDGRCEAALVLAWPDRLHLRAWRGATTLFDFALRGDRVETYLPREERLVRRALRPAAGAVPAAAPSPDDEARARFYRALDDLLRRGDWTPDATAVHEETYELTVARDGTRHLLTVDRRDLDVVRHRIEAPGTPPMEIGTQDYRESAPGLRWPQHVRVRGGGDRPFEITMEFRDVALNVPTPAGAFDVPVPEGTRIDDDVSQSVREPR